MADGQVLLPGAGNRIGAARHDIQRLTPLVALAAPAG
jgi:hypothetical protein